MVEDQLDPSSLEILRDLKVTAVKKWSEARHPGWGIFREPAEGGGDAKLPGAGAQLPVGGISIAPGAGGGLGMAGVKRTASHAGMGDRDDDENGEDDGAGNGVGDGSGGLLATPLGLKGITPAGAITPEAIAAAAATAAAGGWPALPTLTPEALAALQAQIAMGELPAGVAGLDDGAGGAPKLDEAAVAAMALAPLPPGLDGIAAAVPGLSPEVLQALQAQLAAGADLSTAVANVAGSLGVGAIDPAGGALPFGWAGAGDAAGGAGAGAGVQLPLAELSIPSVGGLEGGDAAVAAAAAAAVAAAAAAGAAGELAVPPVGGDAPQQQQQDGDAAGGAAGEEAAAAQ
jgi:hypothetical protein